MGAFVKTPMIKRVLSVALAAAFIGGLSGCASTANNPKDPYEGFNRAMFSVNEGFDVVLKPVAEGYDAAAPLPVKAGIGNFFGNISDAWTAINNFLQGKGGEGLSDVGRVLVNTTLGIGGVFDVASEMGLEKHAEDFGQTMAVWGVPEGNYLYWPLIGPRTTRDAPVPPSGAGVSVVMPVLNEERYLRNAVESVMQQEVDGPAELVLALGPSTDATDAIARELAGWCWSPAASRRSRSSRPSSSPTSASAG